MSRVASVEHLESTISGGISTQMGDTGICDKGDVMSSSNIHISQVTKIVLKKNVHISISRCRIMVHLTIWTYSTNLYH